MLEWLLEDIEISALRATIVAVEVQEGDLLDTLDDFLISQEDGEVAVDLVIFSEAALDDELVDLGPHRFMPFLAHDFREHIATQEL